MSANAQMTAKGDAMYYVHSFLCLLIMFGFGQLPPVEPLTALGMRLIGIFLGLLYGWIFIDIVWPSMAGLLALMLVGGMKPVALLNRSFGDPIVVMMFFISRRFINSSYCRLTLVAPTAVSSTCTTPIFLSAAAMRPIETPLK